MTYASKTMTRATAFVMIERCIAESAFVEAWPLPGDLYELSVKKDRKDILNQDYVVVLRGPGPVNCETVNAFDLSSALALLTADLKKVCYVGSYTKGDTVEIGSYELVFHDDELETGFIIRAEEGEGGECCYKVEEWMNGDIVDQFYSKDYQGARIWISENLDDHCARRFSMQDLCELWNKFADVPVSEGAEFTEGAFLFFPAGTPTYDIGHFFMSCNPNFIVGEAGRYIGPRHKFRTL